MGQCGTCPPSPSRGVEKGRGTGGNRDAGQIAHPGGPEYALHSADGTQPGGNAPPHPTPQCTSYACIPSSVSALLIPAGAEAGGQSCSKWGEGQVVLYALYWLLCVDPGSVLPTRAYIDSRVFTPTSGSSVGGRGCMFCG